MAPLADAMGLVDRDHVDADAAQQGADIRQAFGRQIQKPQGPGLKLCMDALVFLGRVVRGQRARRHARVLQGRDLVAHQRDQRRDDHRHPVARQGGQLKAQRLAAARRHDRQNVAARQDRFDDLPLAGAEGVEAEDGAEKGGEILHGGCRLGFHRMRCGGHYPRARPCAMAAGPL